MKEGLNVNLENEGSPDSGFSHLAYNAYVSKFYERNHQAMLKRRELFSMLDKQDFKKEEFLKNLNSWNDEEVMRRGFDGDAKLIETISNEHGSFDIYFFPTGAVKFENEIA